MSSAVKCSRSLLRAMIFFLHNIVHNDSILSYKLVSIEAQIVCVFGVNMPNAHTD